jgi:hypothetical protein
MGRRLADATNARFTRRTRGDASLRRFTGFFRAAAEVEVDFFFAEVLEVL